MPRSDVPILLSTRIIRLFAYGFVSVILAFYLIEAGLDERAVGLLFTLTLARDAGISLWLTTSADRIGRRRTLMIGAMLVEETGAIPFDRPGVELGHHDGNCPFESIIQKFDLKEPGLLRLARIVYSADVSEDIDKGPIARDLEAIASGYSLRFPDDLENLEGQFEVYDALYAWCRLQVAGN